MDEEARSGWQRLGWFVLIWAGSVLALGVVAELLHGVMGLLGMRH